MTERDQAARELSSAQLAHYERARARGSSHRLALMLASARPPGADRSDDRLRRPNEEIRARPFRGRAGSYHPSLARFPNDPQAVIQSRGDARRLCDRRGWKLTDDPVTNRHGSVQERSAAEAAAPW